MRDFRPRVAVTLAEPARSLPGALVDTSFSGALAVPEGTFARWAVQDPLDVNVALADGSHRDCPAIEAVVLWLGQRREELVLELGHDTVVGMRLLLGCALTLSESRVVIRRVPRQGP